MTPLIDVVLGAVNFAKPVLGGSPVQVILMDVEVAELEMIVSLHCASPSRFPIFPGSARSFAVMHSLNTIVFDFPDLACIAASTFARRSGGYLANTDAGMSVPLTVLVTVIFQAPVVTFGGTCGGDAAADTSLNNAADKTITVRHVEVMWFSQRGQINSKRGQSGMALT